MNKIKYLAWILLTLVFLVAGCGSSDDDSGSTLADGEVVKFTLLQTTDVHHRAIGTGPSASYGTDTDLTQGGYARIATKVTEIRRAKTAEGTPVVLVDSGDYLMGTVYDLTLGGVPAAMSFISLMKYDAVTLGNHEFDYGPEPLSGFLNAAIGEDRSGFQVPVLASNMVTASGDKADDGLEALKEEGRIKETLLLTLPNGLKVGLLGLMGQGAEADAPLAAPVTFKNNLADAAEVAFLQARVDSLKAAGAHVVIALSHSGITKTDTATPEGDDVLLASKVQGIDIIASGHDHEMTADVVTVGDTRIVCAGSYGENLAQLDITVKVGTGVTEAALTNNDLETSVPLAGNITFLVALLDGGINEAIGEAGLPEINTVMATTDSDNVAKPSLPAQSGMGNLVADSLRFMNYALTEPEPAVPTVGVVANGVIRSGFGFNQQISFADIYSVLPLGMTLDPQNQDIPGYPLMKVYLTGQELAHVAQLISYVMAASDSDFIAGLPGKAEQYATIAGQLTVNPADPAAAGALQTLYVGGDLVAGSTLALLMGGDPDGAIAQLTQSARLAVGLYNPEDPANSVLPALGADYFMNISGFRFVHAGANGMYQVDPDTGVTVYTAMDFTCSGPSVPLDKGALYPVIIDLYALLIMQNEVFATMLSELGIPIVPRAIDAGPIFRDSEGNARLFDSSRVGDIFLLLAYRLDTDPESGVQELKEWQALLTFINKALLGLIPDAAYGNAMMTNGAASSRVNLFIPPPPAS